mmetsp:Transcript_15384/g.46444  ORF Transcript_15384/g.46444 Transcript_15384/m.46444 type:complete len:237 (-) Transcript_15384:231-941(-)
MSAIETATLAGSDAHLGSASAEPARLHAQGAESRVWEGEMSGRPCVIKERFSKKYRHPALDLKLTTSRLKQEARGIIKARKLGVLTPVLYHVDVVDAKIHMERVEGHTLKRMLHEKTLAGEELNKVLEQLGKVIARLHDGGVVHGDLTTSNLIVRTLDGALVVIDLGLSQQSTLAEDKAVDLYVLERAFISAHSADGDGLWEVVLASYKASSKWWNPTLNKFAEVRMRGRKRAMVG